MSRVFTVINLTLPDRILSCCIKQLSIVNVDFTEWHLYYTNSAIFKFADFFGNDRHNFSQLSSNNRQFENWTNWIIPTSDPIYIPNLESIGCLNGEILCSKDWAKITPVLVEIY